MRISNKYMGLITRITLLITMAVLVLGGAGQVKAAAGLPGSFRGDAWGSRANAKSGQLATKLGRSAYITCPCNGTGGDVRSNTVYNVASGKQASLQNIYTTVKTTRTATAATVRNTAKVTGLSMLDGRITADSVLAVANTAADAARIRSTPTGSKFVNLVVAGQAIPSNVTPGRRIDLAGLGYVILKQVSRSGDGVNSSYITVNMINVVITQANSLGLPVGSQITIAHARSGFVRAETPVYVGGRAFAATGKSSASDVRNRIGRAAAVYLPCQGTNGAILSNNVHSVSAGDLLTSETGYSTASADETSTGTGMYAQTTSRLRNVSLLSGTIRAERVKAVSRSVLGSGVQSSSTAGSYFDNLRVLGTTIPTTVAPNSRVDLPGIGYVILKETRTSRSSSKVWTQINMIHVFVTTSGNPYGLPAGTEIIVASATSWVHAFR